MNKIYPLEGNEEVMGLNMLEHPERRKEARLAMESGQYTIAGPFAISSIIWYFACSKLDPSTFLSERKMTGYCPICCSQMA